MAAFAAARELRSMVVVIRCRVFDAKTAAAASLLHKRRFDSSSRSSGRSGSWRVAAAGLATAPAPSARTAARAPVGAAGARSGLEFRHRQNGRMIFARTAELDAAAGAAVRLAQATALAAAIAPLEALGAAAVFGAADARASAQREQAA